MSETVITIEHKRGIASGAATIKGIRVAVLFGRWLSGETIAELQDDYDLQAEEVELALRYVAERRSKRVAWRKL